MHVGGSGSSKPGQASGDVELNITSIIDCFVVLIAFLLISSGFLSVGLMDAGIQAGQVAPEATAQPTIQVTAELTVGKTVKLSVTGARKEELVIPAAASGGWDLPRLTEKLAALKQANPGFEGLTLAAEPDVEYRDVVLGMEAVRKTVPNVMLGGF
jgi:biopolymer transport protein ExbD